MKIAATAFFGLAVAAAFGLALAPAHAAESPASPAPVAPMVTVVKAVKREVTASTIVAGTLVPREDVYVLPEVDGLVIDSILAEAGDTVREGQVLARLSRSMLDVQLVQNTATLARNDAAIAQARAQIADAEASAAQAASALSRATQLKGSGITSVDTFEQRQAASRSAAARLQSAKDGLTAALADKQLTQAQRDELELRLKRTDIKAPRAGIISQRNARLGAVAAMSGQPLFRIIADGIVELEADVPEAELPRIRVGQPVSVLVPGHEAPIDGKVRLVSPEVDKTSRLGRVRVTLAAGVAVSIGSFARGTIETGRHTGVTLPLQAIVYRQSGPVAQVVRDGHVETRRIRLGLIGNGIAEIVSGVSEGETVVARAGTFVRDGDTVTPVPATGAEAVR